MNQFIRQLTGVRFVAAAWVLVYHFEPPLAKIGLMLPLVSDVVRVGRLGVDLFFALSGFILTHTYLTRLGPRLGWDGTWRFWWLRLARIWPVHFVMLNVAGLALVAQSRVNGTSPFDREWFNPVDYLKQLLLVQEWGPNPQRGWNFVAWSLSMEWLAYLLFPLLVLLLWRFRERLATRWLAVAWVVAILPLVVYGFSRSDPYYTDNWGSTIRILTEFTAGAITYLIVRRYVLDDGAPRPRVERLATTLSVVMPVLIVLGSIVLTRVPALQPPLPADASADAEGVPPFGHLWLVPLLIVWIGALALSRRGVARWLSTRTLVLGGFISYSLYMTHLVWYGLWRAALTAGGIRSGALYAVAVVILFAGSILLAYAMWRWVEEPAREKMRSMVGARRKPAGEEIVDPGRVV